jgi:Zn-dependent protease
MFNLIPIYPLDGSHVLESLLIRRFPRFFMFMRQYGQIILIILLITGGATSVLSFLVSNVASGFISAANWFINLF